MKIARRIDGLGTETAFAVAQAAGEWKARGNRVFPFHLGDIDLPTAPHIVEAMNAAIADGKTGYCPGPGIPELREALADDIGSRRGMTISADEVVVTTGGKPVITKFLQTVMDPGEGVLYPNPGFPIYESQIEYLGGVPLPYRYVPTADGFAIDLDHLRSLITPRTTALIYNDLQNPISAESTDAEREAVAQIAQEHDLWVLSDEAYFEMRYEGASRSIAALPGMAERTVILYTFSKKFAMTGSRLGCAVAPRAVAHVISTLNTNDESCTTHFVQWAGIAALTGTQEPVRRMLEEFRGAARRRVRPRQHDPGDERGGPAVHVLRLPRRHGCRPSDGPDERQRVRGAGAAQHRGLLLHARALRKAAAGRGPGVHQARVLRDRARRHHGGAHPSARVGGLRVSARDVCTA